MELARQFSHPLALLLWGAAALAVVSNDMTLAVAIVAVIVINAILAFAQEVQAEHATEALGAFLPSHARVRRDGELAEVEVTLLVPGDVVLLGEGDRLSADVRLISGGVDVDMSPLTGESQPVAREASDDERAATLLEAQDVVFAGTLCTAGEAEGVVYATGMATQLGRIAALSQRVKVESSPLQRQVNRAAWLIAAIAVASGVVFFIAGITVGLPVAFAVTAAIGLLVGNVPEGLLPIITLSLAGAVRRMARRRALVKRLTAVETLGSTNVICTDKTGTLTEGRMAVRVLWAEGSELQLSETAVEGDLSGPLAALVTAAVLCNNASLQASGPDHHLVGDPTEIALLLAAQGLRGGIERALPEYGWHRQRAYAFDSHRKRMTTLDQASDGALVLHSKGAPLELLGCCDTLRGANDTRPLDAATRERIMAAFEQFASRGLRVLAFAERFVDADAEFDDRDAAESGLTFLGLAALEDPLRPEVPGAVARCRAAGIRIIVITGDYGLTATAIARQAGITRGQPKVVTGAEVDELSERELDALLLGAEELIVARSNPETKLHLVDALRAQGNTVAMTGDGVNDAPALRRADIGIAMGASGTDVAREAATMILTDDNFASIVAAVEEGRVVYDNVRKFITYIFTHAPAEALPFIIFVAAGGAIPLPLLPLQVLAIDLGTDTVPALALGREAAEPGIMERPPRPRESGIIERAMLVRAWLRMGMIEAVMAMSGFFVVLVAAGWSPGDATGSGHPLHHAYVQATTMTWAGIVSGQIGASFAARTTHGSLREIGVFANRHLLRGIAVEVVFAAAVIYFPPLESLLHTTGLNLWEICLLSTFPFLVWGVDELNRAVRRRQLRRKPRVQSEPGRASV